MVIYKTFNVNALMQGLLTDKFYSMINKPLSYRFNLNFDIIIYYKCSRNKLLIKYLNKAAWNEVFMISFKSFTKRLPNGITHSICDQTEESFIYKISSSYLHFVLFSLRNIYYQFDSH